MKRQKGLTPLKKISLYIAFIVLVLVVFFPAYWIIATSLKTQTEIYASPATLFPQNPTLENYRFAIEEGGVLRFSLNSIFTAGCTMLLTVAVAVLASYPLTRLAFRGKKLFFGLLASTQVFPVVITIVPLYMMYRQAQLYNSYLSLILTYTATCVPVAIVLMMGYFRDIPTELEEAASIDGCGRLRTLWRIILPISRPGIVASGIYIFLTNWQEYLVAVSLISDRAKYTLTLGLTLFQTVHSTNWGALMATAVILAVPAVILFLAIERQFIDGLAGAVKE